MASSDENIEAAKRVKQLENQNLKLKRLLQTAEDIFNQDLVRNARQKIENTDLMRTISNLEEEKIRLEQELTEIIQKNESGMVRALRKLEQEHTELQTELHNVLAGINEDHNEIVKLENEDLELRSALLQLEQEKCRLIEKIKTVDDENSTIAEQSCVVEQKMSALSNLHKETVSSHNVIRGQELATNNESSDQNILSTFIQLEQTYKEYIDVLEEHTLENTISDLTAKHERLASEVQHSKSEDKQSQLRLNETILHSNTNILNKIKDVKSKLATSIEMNSNLINTAEEAQLMGLKISEMEKERDIIYEELEEYLQTSSKEICKLAENVHDPEMKLLVHEIEVQKAVLLYNLKMLRMKGETTIPTSKSDVNTKEIFAPPSSPASMLHQDSDEIKQLYTNDNEACGKSSSFEGSDSDGHHRLEETVTRLENERMMLLKQLHSLSGTSPQRYEERQLQTQSELHSMFMREESSQEVVITKNLDDATNQLYTEEDIRLEQRIRELEIDNNRIKLEVQRLVESVPDYHLPAQALRERIEELEKQTQSQSHIG